MIKVVVATDLSRLPDKVRDYVETEFDRLAFAGKARIVRPPSATVALERSVFDDCDVVVTRPTGGLWTKIHPDDFKNNQREKVHLFTVSAGLDSLNAFRANEAKFKIGSPRVANEAGVAACTVMMASELLFRSGLGSANIRRGRFSGAGDCTSLAGKTWTIYGSGRQVTELVDLLHATGVERIIIYNDRLDETKFDRCLSILNSKFNRGDDSNSETLSYQRSGSGCSAVIRFPKAKWDKKSGKYHTTTHELRIDGDLSKEESFGSADIVSIHLPLVREAVEDRRPTYQMINSSFLRLLKRKPVLINVSRGEVLNEDQVLGALNRGELSGVGVDVLDSETEHSSDSGKSPLWTALRKQEEAKAEGSLAPGRERNLIITPHIAGSVDTDVGPMWEDVVGEVCALAGGAR